MRKKITTGVLAVLACILCSMTTVFAEEQNVISDGVYIGDMDVSGMTVEEAKAYVKSEVQKLGSSEITIQMGDDQVTTTWKDLGLKWKNTDLVEEISQLGTTGNIVRRYKEQKDLQN